MLKRIAALTLIGVLIAPGILLVILNHTPYRFMQSTRVLAQQVFELSCPAGTQSIQHLQTNDNVTGKGRQNFCVDNAGNLTNISSSGATLSANVINASNPLYAGGVTAAGNEDCFATFTNGSSVITLSSNTLLPPALAINTWKAFGTATCIDSPSYTEVLPVGTITAINTATRQVTVSTIANASAAGTATQHFIFAPIEDNQLTAAENAAWNYGGMDCYTLVLPSGIIGVLKGHFNTLTCNIQSTGPQSTGAHIFGWGRVATRIMQFPGFDYTTCPLLNSLHTCFGAVNGLTKERFGISGGQDPGTDPAATTCLINDGTDDFSINIGLFGTGSSLDHLAGYCMTSVGTTSQVVIEDGAGSIGGYMILASSGNGSCSQCFFGNNKGTSASLNATGALFIFATSNAKFMTMGTGFGETLATSGIVTVTANGLSGTYKSVGDVIVTPASGSNYFLCDHGATCDIDGISEFGSITGNFSAFGSASGISHFIVKNSNLSTGTSGTVWNLNTATSIGDDAGGNTFTDAGGAAVIVAGASLRTLVPTSTYSVPLTAGQGDCVSSAAPAVCNSHVNGSVVVAASATTVTVNTTAIRSNSEVILNEDSSLGTRLGVTCNTTPATALTTTTRTTGTSFVITTNAPTTNPRCINFEIR